LENDNVRRARYIPAREKAPDVREARNVNPDFGRGDEPLSVRGAISRYREQARQDASFINSETDASATQGAVLPVDTDTPDAVLPDEQAAERFTQIEDAPRFGSRTDPRGDDGAPPRSQHGAVFSRKFEEFKREAFIEEKPLKHPTSPEQVGASAEPERAEISDGAELSSNTQPPARGTLAVRERPERFTDTRPGRLRFDSGGKAERASFPRRQAPPSDASFTAGVVSAPVCTGAESAAAEPPLAVPDVTDTQATAEDTPEQRIPSPDVIKPRNGKPSKLQFGDVEKSDTAPTDKKLAQERSKAERSSEQPATAQERLPANRRVRSRRIFDENKGKHKRELSFEKEVKSQQKHLTGSVVARTVKTGVNAAVAYGHRQIYMTENDNLGVEAAHRAGTLAEGGLREFYRAHKAAPYRKVKRLTQKTTKLNMRSDYLQDIYDDPKLKSSSLSRAAQKRKIQRQYAKAARDAKRSARSVKNTGGFVDKATRSAGRAVTRHPVALIIIAAFGLVIAVISGAFAACGSIVSGGGSFLAGSYLAEDADIDMAELSYTEWETDLQLGITNAETYKPGFDEYRYSVDEISHNPYELMAYLTAKFQAFKYSDIESELRDIFDEQYHLTFTESVETRYADPNDVDDDDDLEPYEWSVLTVTLASRSFTDVITGRLDGDLLRHYNLLMQTKGSRRLISESPVFF
jgi:hypothetical protein